MSICPLLVAVALMAPADGAPQDDGPLPSLAPDRPFSLTFTPGVWIPRATGEVSLGTGPLSVPLHVRHDLDLESMEATPNFELALRTDRWRLHLGGFDFETEGTATLPIPYRFGDAFVPAGGTAATSLELTSISMELGYTVLVHGSEQPWAWSPPTPGPAAEDGDRLGDFRLTPFVGARYIRVRFGLDAGAGGQDEGEGRWLALYGGLHAQFNLRLGDRIQWLQLVRVDADMGLGPALGGDGGIVWQVRLGLTIAPTPNVGLMIGYRLLEIDAEEDGLDYVGGLQGLFFGVSIRF